jgi:HEPN domain-containing protein
MRDGLLEALQGCMLPVQPWVARPKLLARHGDAPFWRSVRSEAISLLQGSVFPVSTESDRRRARLWLQQANDDLKAVHLLQAGAQTAQACCLAQPVGEKAIKALLAAQDRDLRSHSLSALLPELDPKAAHHRQRQARILDKLDAPTRYPMPWGTSYPRMCSVRRMAKLRCRPRPSCSTGLPTSWAEPSFFWAQLSG